MMAETEIRIATSADANVVRGLHKQSWSEVFDQRHAYPEDGLMKWQEALANTNEVTWIASLEKDPVGYLRISLSSDPAEITDLFVAPLARRKGMARELLNKALLNVTSVTLWVAKTNYEAIALYESVGFSQTGRVRPEPRRMDASDLTEMILD